jgi:hypothetical protein
MYLLKKELLTIKLFHLAVMWIRSRFFRFTNSYVNEINKFQATYDTTGDFVFKTATGHIYQTFTGPYTNNKFGRTLPAPYTTYINNLMVGGSIANGRLFTNSPSFPPVLPNDMDEWAPGDFVLNRSGLITGVLGWRRITTGTNNFLGVDWEEFKTATATNPITYKNSLILDASNNLYVGDSGRVQSAVAGQYSSAKLPPGAVYQTIGTDQTGVVLFKMPWTFSMGCDFIIEGIINTRAKGNAGFKITSRFLGSNTFTTPILDYMPDSNMASIKIRMLKDASNAPYLAFYDTTATVTEKTYIRIQNVVLLGNANATMVNATLPWTTSLVTSLTPYTVLNILSNSAVTTVANGGTSNFSFTANRLNYYDGNKIASSSAQWSEANGTLTISNNDGNGGLIVKRTVGANTGELDIGQSGGRGIVAKNNGVSANLDITANQTNFNSHLLLASQKQLQFTSFDNTIQNLATILASSGNTLDFVVNSITGMSINNAGHTTFNGTVKIKVYTVATLPTAVQGMYAFVNDALTPVNGATVVGGGGVPVPVYYNGTNWIVMGAGGFWLRRTGGMITTAVSTDSLTSWGHALKVNNVAVGTTSMDVLMRGRWIIFYYTA